jgi:hypothetical protein
LELKFALLADHVNITREGKLNLIGEFDKLFAQKVPAMHPMIFLVARFEASVSEGTEHRFAIGLYDEDGQAVLPKSPPIPMRFETQGRGRPLRAQVITQLGGVRFPKYGAYEFHLLIDGREMGVIPISVTEPPPPPERKKGGKS